MYFASCFDMKNVVVDSISRYADGDVYKHHIFCVFVVNDFKWEKIFINVFIVYVCCFSRHPWMLPRKR